MATGALRNGGRWLLGVQMLVFFVLGGFQLWAFPEETCPYMALSRAVVEDRVACPQYAGDHPVFEMYTFSLGKHLTMIGVVFAWFAIRGRSKAVIHAGLVYVPVALAIDCVPPLTWLGSAGVVGPGWPPICVAALLSVALSAAGIVWNARAAEWQS